MALTITPVFSQPVPIGDRWMNVVSVAFDASYPTGGLSLKPTDLGFTSAADPEWHIHIGPQAGYIFVYDYTNQKLLAYDQKDPAAAGGADIALPQVGNTVNLATLTGVRVTAYGRYRG